MSTYHHGVLQVLFYAIGGMLFPPAYDLARNDLHPILHSKLDTIFMVLGALGIYAGLFVAFVAASAINKNTTSLIPFSVSLSS